LLWLVGCNGLPPEDDFGGDDQSLQAKDSVPDKPSVPGTAGQGANDFPNGTADVSPSTDLDCQIKAKECYAQGNDPALCEAVLKGCQPPPATSPPCGGEDCDASVRACYAKGVDAKTCDAHYHECLSGKAPGGSASVPKEDPAADCLTHAKECFAQNGDPAKCEALLASCTTTPPPKPVPDPALDCKLKYTKCIEAGVDLATCDELIADCR
jgi:hypothetical protein